MGLGGPSLGMDGCAFPWQLGRGLRWTRQAWKHPVSGPSCSPGLLDAARCREWGGDRLVPRERQRPVPPRVDTVDTVEPVGRLVHLFIKEIYGAMAVLGAEAAVVNNGNKKY